MTQKHEFIKKLYKEGDILGLDNEKEKIDKIVFNYKKQLRIILKEGNKEEVDKIENILKYNERLLKFIKRVKYILYKKLNKICNNENNNG